jgi:hypothetical protein
MGACPYFPQYMLRKLLTLLAICAGLAAVAEPARAAVTTVESVRLVEQAGLACTAGSRARLSQAEQRSEGPVERVKNCPKPTIVLIVPAVMLQADRARE